ncbi:MAG: hypothetical protein QW727_04045 [Candidatus Pacearchaeota archaeon]
MRRKTKGINLGIQIIFGILMAILLVVGTNLGISAFFPEPIYDKFCPSNIQPYIDKINSPPEFNQTAQNLLEQCNTNFNKAVSKYKNQIFYFFVIIGVLFALLGLYISKDNFIWQIIFTAGGIILIIEAVIQNYQAKIPSFFAIVFAFVILSIFISKKLKRTG